MGFTTKDTISIKATGLFEKGSDGMVEKNVYFESTDQIQEFIRIVGHFEGDIDICFGSYVVDGKSIMGIVSLGTQKNLRMQILSEDCKQLLEQLQPFIREE